jgi:hypothetical protein
MIDRIYTGFTSYFKTLLATLARSGGGRVLNLGSGPGDFETIEWLLDGRPREAPGRLEYWIESACTLGDCSSPRIGGVCR